VTEELSLVFMVDILVFLRAATGLAWLEFAGAGGSFGEDAENGKEIIPSDAW
jgi:hypothetical protein